MKIGFSWSRLEAIEAALLKKVELEEYEWLRSLIRNPAFQFLNAPEEDIYTLDDGKPFHDPEWAKSVINNPSFGFITDQPTTEDEIPVVTRSHEAFLKSYSPEDEGLYDDYQSR